MSTVSIKYKIWGAVPIDLLQDESITPTALRVYIALASFQGTNENAFPSLEAIADRAGVTYSAIPAATKCLADAGWIIKHRRGLGQSNVYELLIKGQSSEKSENTEFRKVRKSRVSETSETKTTLENNTRKQHSNIAPTLDLVSEEATAAPSAPKDTSLFQAIKESFLAVTPTFSNWGKEARAIKTIEERIQKQSLDDPLHRAKLVLTTFYTLTKTGSEFWRGQPFIPSALASSGIWDRVMLEVDRGTKEAEAVNDVSWVGRNGNE